MLVSKILDFSNSKESKIWVGYKLGYSVPRFLEYMSNEVPFFDIGW